MTTRRPVFPVLRPSISTKSNQSAFNVLVKRFALLAHCNWLIRAQHNSYLSSCHLWQVLVPARTLLSLVSRQYVLSGKTGGHLIIPAGLVWVAGYGKRSSHQRRLRPFLLFPITKESLSLDAAVPPLLSFSSFPFFRLILAVTRIPLGISRPLPASHFPQTHPTTKESPYETA
ncbi:hypothetical protein Moror_10648 [Moniliophthora roreri MCA 2997]|uniref:Uncharacterized protein n=1 Tax=Moniliophthora roreri (strain MCA 2997) TaxID=1381753 RepID=V2XGU5_MONRO|nr:hypothetical protein Moror_10648 [Moniliophthora roreri MCA 2997]